MGKLVAGLAAGLIAAVMLVFFTAFGTLMGALSGWIVGWFFSDTILTFFSVLAGTNIAGLQMWEVGAALGFIGGFFKTTTVQS